MMHIIGYLFERIKYLKSPSIFFNYIGNGMNKLTSLLLLILLVLTYDAHSEPLTLKVYNADKNSFHVNSTLIFGDTEAAVIDTGFTKADALRIAANVLDSGKKLTTIFISQADPDYYFGAETLLKIFPDAKVITTPKVRKIIKEKMTKKLAYWAPKMAKNAPSTPVLPLAYDKNFFTVDGYQVEIKSTSGVLAHRPYLWIPSKKALLGNVAIFGQLHVWTADVQQQKTWQAWLTQLEEMMSLSPEIVIPGHMKSNTALNSKTIKFTTDYLIKFAQANKVSKDSTTLMNMMNKAYPDLQLPIALQIGAKVHQGEMKW